MSEVLKQLFAADTNNYTFLTKSLTRSSPVKVGTQYLSQGNVHWRCSCWVRFLMLYYRSSGWVLRGH